MLGISGRALAERKAYFGQGKGSIHLDDVRCFGNENSLLTCPNAGLGSHNCHHSKDAGVRCGYDPPSPIVRLVNGNSFSEGRVEIYVNGIWGTVCDDDWDDNDARVICNMLGISGQAKAVANAHYGPGYGLIHLDDVSCTGSEVSLLGCWHVGSQRENCDHSEDAGVACGINVSVCGHRAWTYLEYINICYSMYYQNITWTDARQACQNIGGDLVSLSTPRKHIAAVRFLREFEYVYVQRAWIGLRYTGSNVRHTSASVEDRRASWQWVDGSRPNRGYASEWQEWHNSSPSVYDDYSFLFHMYSDRASYWYSTNKATTLLFCLCERVPRSRILGSSTSPSIQVSASTSASSSTTTTTTTTTEQSTTESSIATVKEIIINPQSQATPSASQTRKPERLGNQWQYSKEAKCCYRIQTSPNPISWDEAEKRCKAINAHLAYPSTKVQHDVVDDLTRQADLSDTDVWIGLFHDNGASGQDQHQLRQGWKWLDGSPYSFEAWSPEEPEEGERYARLKQGKWYGTGGSYSLFLCQKEPASLISEESSACVDKNTEANTGKNYKFAFLALLVIPVLLAVVVATVYSKRKHRKKDNGENDENEQYCEIDELDSRPSPSSEAHVYYNETKFHEKPALKKSRHMGVPVLPNDIQNQTQAGVISNEIESPGSHIYTNLQKSNKAT